MTLDDFNKQLAKLLGEFFKGLDVGNVPIRMTFQLYEESPDEKNPLRVDLAVRRVWAD